jgi:outer membrane protein
MKQRASLLLLLSVFVGGFVLSVGAAELKIGLVDSQKIFEGTKRGKKIKDMLSEYVQARQRVIASEESELKKLESELASQASRSSAKVKEEKEQTFNQKMGAYQRRVQELEREVQTKKREALGEFTKAMEQVVQAIAEKEKIVLVLEKGSPAVSGGGAIRYNQDSLDLTGRVIKELDSRGGD